MTTITCPFCSADVPAATVELTIAATSRQPVRAECPACGGALLGWVDRVDALHLLAGRARVAR